MTKAKKVFRNNGNVREEGEQKDISSIDDDGKIIASFLLNSIEFKNRDSFWNLKLSLQCAMTECAFAYNLLLDYNQQGDVESCDDLRGKIDQLENENTLFGGEKEKLKKELELAIKGIEKHSEEQKKELGKIEFNAITASFVAETRTVVFKIPAEVVAQIIAILPKITKFKITLKPITL